MKTNNTPNSSKLERLWLVLTDPEAAPLYGGLLFLICVFLFLFVCTSGVLPLVSVGVIGMALTGIAYITYTGWNTFGAFQHRFRREQAVAWARSAETQAEQESRMASISTLGATGALIDAGVSLDAFAPAFNIDGTPMMGGGIDAKGNVFGMTDSAEIFNQNHDGLPIGGYHEPIGMGTDSTGIY